MPTADRLLACDFDSSTCGFEYTGDHDWRYNTGAVPSTWRNTGPSGDHTSGTGYYMYVYSYYTYTYSGWPDYTYTYTCD